ncbi:MAG: helix-turn-helix domain-containing protein [Polyangiaceae bacterium]|nr:helix-turn-helix domain-containing protein [Myxococcales bacterium]MCB9585016.1 helix-turn-helix domain-containing protein [Polyangiaceae bacterium]
MARATHPTLLALGRAVRMRRRERSLTIGALSKRASVSERFLHELEAGRGNISVVRLCDVAQALGTTAAELLRKAEPESSNVIALLGMRGAGKSTVGPRLAARLKLPFVELDQLVEENAGMTLGEVFELQGEAFYRRLERETLRKFLRDTSGGVLATGGSIVSDAETFDLLKRSSTTVWLRARPEDHMERVLAQGDTRPMRNRTNAMAELKALLKARTPLYAQADHVVETNSMGIDGTVDFLAESISGEETAPAAD